MKQICQRCGIEREKGYSEGGCNHWGTRFARHLWVKPIAPEQSDAICTKHGRKGCITDMRNLKAGCKPIEQSPKPSNPNKGSLESASSTPKLVASSSKLVVEPVKRECKRNR